MHDYMSVKQLQISRSEHPYCICIIRTSALYYRHLVWSLQNAHTFKCCLKIPHSMMQTLPNSNRRRKPLYYRQHQPAHTEFLSRLEEFLLYCHQLSTLTFIPSVVYVFTDFSSSVHSRSNVKNIRPMQQQRIEMLLSF